MERRKLIIHLTKKKSEYMVTLDYFKRFSRIENELTFDKEKI